MLLDPAAHWMRVAEEEQHHRDLRRAALHEAAHAIIARLLAVPVEQVALNQDGSGYTLIGSFQNVSPRVRLVLLAVGAAAVGAIGAGLDNEHRHALADSVTGSVAAAAELLIETEQEARLLVRAHWGHIQALAAGRGS
jgi:hypothetical protein